MPSSKSSSSVKGVPASRSSAALASAVARLRSSSINAKRGAGGGGAGTGTVVTQPVDNERCVRCAVVRLHRCDDTQFRKARDVSGMQVLRVFHSPAQVLPVRKTAEDGLIQVQHFAVRAVSDRVRAQLEVMFDGQ